MVIGDFYEEIPWCDFRLLASGIEEMTFDLLYCHSCVLAKLVGKRNRKSIMSYNKGRKLLKSDYTDLIEVYKTKGCVKIDDRQVKRVDLARKRAKLIRN